MTFGELCLSSSASLTLTGHGHMILAEILVFYVSVDNNVNLYPFRISQFQHLVLPPHQVYPTCFNPSIIPPLIIAHLKTLVP